MPRTTPPTPRERLVFRLLLTLIGLSCAGLGLLSILSRHYDGRTTKYVAHAITLDGAQAVGMGFVLLFLGLLTLGVWFNSRARLVGWCLACAVAAGVALYRAIYLAH